MIEPTIERRQVSWWKRLTYVEMAYELSDGSFMALWVPRVLRSKYEANGWTRI